MKNLNWKGFAIVVAVCALAGFLNQNMPMLDGLILGSLGGLIFGAFILIES